MAVSAGYFVAETLPKPWSSKFQAQNSIGFGAHSIKGSAMAIDIYRDPIMNVTDAATVLKHHERLEAVWVHPRRAVRGVHGDG